MATIKTGIEGLDRLVSPLSGFIVLYGNTGVGKSALALNIADYVAKKGDTAVLFSFEMSANEQTIRQLSFLSGVPATKLRMRSLTTEEVEKAKGVSESLKDYGDRLILFDHPFSFFQIKDMLLQLKGDGRLDLAIIDSFELLKEVGFIGSREEELCYIGRELKAISLSLEIPIIVTSTTKKIAKSKRGITPLDYLKASLAEQADVATFLTREESNAVITVAKNRYGKSLESVPLTFSSDTIFFTE